MGEGISRDKLEAVVAENIITNQEGRRKKMARALMLS